MAQRIQCDGVLAIASGDGSAASHWVCEDDQGVSQPFTVVHAPDQFVPADNIDSLMQFFGAGWAIVVAFFLIAYPIRHITRLFVRS